MTNTNDPFDKFINGMDMDKEISEEPEVDCDKMHPIITGLLDKLSSGDLQIIMSRIEAQAGACLIQELLARSGLPPEAHADPEFSAGISMTTLEEIIRISVFSGMSLIAEAVKYFENKD